MNKRKLTLILSLILPLISIFIDKYKHIDDLRHVLGIPFNFFWVYDYTLTSSRFEIFKLGKLSSILFKLEIYIACVIFFYVLLSLVFLLIEKYNANKIAK